MRNKRTFMEIENLENEIRNEIDEKYNPIFDENDLSCENIKKNQNMNGIQQLK